MLQMEQPQGAIGSARQRGRRTAHHSPKSAGIRHCLGEKGVHATGESENTEHLYNPSSELAVLMHGSSWLAESVRVGHLDGELPAAERSGDTNVLTAARRRPRNR